MLTGSEEEQIKQFTRPEISEFQDLSLDLLSTTKKDGKVIFAETLKDTIFYAWYRAGKPSAGGLFTLVERLNLGLYQKPANTTLKVWLTEFYAEAERLDSAATMAIDEFVVAEKVEMLKRHSEIGKKMQERAIKFLDENPEQISAGVALKMLVEGVRIEKESAGIPDALGKMTQLSDEQLLKELQKIISNAPILEADLLLPED